MAFLKTLLLGARGVGKTELLKRWQKSSSFKLEILWIDLDEEIQKATGQSIDQIFKNQGEAFFRKLEFEQLNSLLKRPEKMVVATGAGFDWKNYSFPIQKSEIELLWIRRPTDISGRIFFNRPRLNLDKTELQEFLDRQKERELEFAKIADRVYIMPEGLVEVSTNEQRLLENTLPSTLGLLTLTPLNQRWNWQGPVEIRSDLWSSAEIEIMNPDLALWTFRDLEKKEVLQRKIKEKDWVDWPLELGSDPIINHPWIIFSLHDRLQGESVAEAGQRLISHPAWHHKLSVVVSGWTELQEGWQWQREDPERRSFLPRTQGSSSLPKGASPQWKWYRLWAKSQQKINFIQDGTNPVADQPTFYEWFATPDKFKFFAAVLGDPIFHSRSPIEHQNFFLQRGWPFFSIPIAKQDWNLAFTFLKQLGLRAAAVTSPLKQEFGEAMNTLFVNPEGKEELVNTDLLGLKTLLSEVKDKCGVIWGGGGTLSSVQEIYPSALAYSVRTGEPRQGQGITEPEVLIWAAGPRDESPKAKKLGIWKPRLVIDLNYREDSEARSYAQEVKATYVSGLELFKAQAQGQREFWQKRIPL